MSTSINWQYPETVQITSVWSNIRRGHLTREKNPWTPCSISTVFSSCSQYFSASSQEFVTRLINNNALDISWKGWISQRTPSQGLGVSVWLTLIIKIDTVYCPWDATLHRLPTLPLNSHHPLHCGAGEGVVTRLRIWGSRRQSDLPGITWLRSYN